MVTRKLVKEFRELQNKTEFHQNIWKDNILTEKGHLHRQEELPDSRVDERGLIDWCSNIFVGGEFAKTTNEIGLRKSQITGSTTMTEKQSRILGTFLPDKLFSIIDTEDQASAIVGVVLFGDVSGFTNICELYSSYKGGAYRLTATLNSYIGSMVEIVYEFKGDIMKFSGDAFLAVWEVNKHEYIYNVIHRVVCCALAIQSTVGTYLTPENLCLEVKLSISSGHMTVKVIGDDFYKSFLVYGPPILEVKMGQDLSDKGDVTLGPAAWGFLSSHNYKFEYTEMGYVKIKLVIYDPMKPKKVPSFVTAKPKLKIDIDEKYKYLKKFDMEVECDELNTDFERAVRPSLFVPEVKTFCRRFRSFLVTPVLQQIDADQPLEFLIEMRQITLMFVNMVPTVRTTNEVIKLTHNAYCTLASIVGTNNLGIINKVCLFDKDIMFLIVFGLRGFKHKDETLRCLKSSEVALKVLKAEEGVKSVSIGVTVGMSYCGVVGHPLRKEFTVIGRPVNKAARLMCAFEDKVTCDKAAFQNSTLPESCFTLLPNRKLKGFTFVEDIYEFKDVGPLIGYEMAAPILGREEEISKFMEILNGSEYQGVALYGEPRTGKSRLIQEFAHLAGKEGWVSVWAMSGMRKNFQTYVLREIFEKFYGQSSRKRKAGLNQVFKNNITIKDYLYLLNGFADVEFPSPGSKLAFPQTVLTKYLILKALDAADMKVLIIVEDAELLMQGSYMMLRELISLDSVKLVFTVSHKLVSRSSTEYFISSNNMLKLHLTNLDPDLTPVLACQLLDVKAVPVRLCIILQKMTKGNPGWLQSCLSMYKDKGILSIQTVREMALRKMKKMITPDPSLLKKDTDNKEDGDTGSVRICFIEKEQEMSKKVIASFDNIIVTAFDHLEPFEQFVLKCCSVLGLSFERKYLNHVMKHPNPIAVVKALGRLFRLKFLVCTLVNPNRHRYVQGMMERLSEELLCSCDIPEFDESDKFPNYYYCQNPGFPFTTFRETIYDLMPPNQKREFHARALTYVQKLPTKCGRCVEIGKERTKKPGVVRYFGHTPISRVSHRVMSHFSERKLTEPFSSACSIMTMDDEETDDVESVQNAGEERETEVERQCSGPSVNVQREPGELRLWDDSFMDVIDKLRRSFRRVKSLVDRGSRQTEIKIKESINPDYPGLNHCKCYQVIREIYPQLIEHSMSSGDFEVCINYLIQYAKSLMHYGNYSEALELMIEANGYLTHLKKTVEPPLPEQEFTIIYVRVTAALGEAYLNLGLVDQSVNTLTAIIPLMRSKTQVWVDWLYTKLPLVSKYNKKLVVDTLSANAEVHMVITSLYVHHNFWVSAFSSAQNALRTALIGRQLEHICAAYTNLFDIMLQNGLSTTCRATEEKVLQIITNLYIGKDKTEVMAVGKLLNIILILRFCRGEHDKVLELAPNLLKLIKQFKALKAKSKCAPYILYSAICTQRLKEAGRLVLMFMPHGGGSRIELSQHDAVARGWSKSSVKNYCGVCLQLYFSTGLTYYEGGSIEDCFKTLISVFEDRYISVEFPSSRLLALAIWLWHLRRREFTVASTKAVQDQKTLISRNFVYQYMTLLQCQLLWLVHQIDLDKNVYNIVQQINIEIKKIGIATSRVELSARSRYLHLKAYFLMIQKKEKRAKFNLMKAHRIAEKHNNRLEIAWITCSRKTWFGPDAAVLRDRLLNRYLSSPRVTYEEINEDLNWDEIMYPLPLPRSPLKKANWSRRTPPSFAFKKRSYEKVDSVMGEGSDVELRKLNIRNRIKVE